MSTITERPTKTAASTVSGGHLVARALRAEGIEAVFTLPLRPRLCLGRNCTGGSASRPRRLDYRA